MTTTAPDPIAPRLLEAILPHVPFDGWSPTAFDAACRDADVEKQAARAACPRGATDLAVRYHHDGDARMVDAYGADDTDALRIRDKITLLIRLRLEAADDKEVVRRGTALFSLPHLVPEGARLVWGTADAMWTALDDPSEDINWYTKRATLSAVYGSVVLYWLGDDSLDHQATFDFIERRIEDVMRFEGAKAQVRNNRLLRPLTGPMEHLASLVRAPARGLAPDLPGSWASPRN